jgi:hypothetical protein
MTGVQPFQDVFLLVSLKGNHVQLGVKSRVTGFGSVPRSSPPHEKQRMTTYSPCVCSFLLRLVKVTLSLLEKEYTFNRLKAGGLWSENNL